MTTLSMVSPLIQAGAVNDTIAILPLEVAPLLRPMARSRTSGTPKCREFSVPFSLQGGNGSSIDFGGTTNCSDSFSKNFGLNLSAIVADGEFLDDAEVTVTGSFGVSNGFSIGAETI